MIAVLSSRRCVFARLAAISYGLFCKRFSRRDDSKDAIFCCTSQNGKTNDMIKSIYIAFYFRFKILLEPNASFSASHLFQSFFHGVDCNLTLTRSTTRSICANIWHLKTLFVSLNTRPVRSAQTRDALLFIIIIKF